jgi:hypothetical protein
VSDPHPRFVVREITGYPGPSTAGNAPERTSVWVADTWNCHREVATFYSVLGGDPTTASIAARRGRAVATCDRLNAEHDAWLAAG